MTIDHHHGTTIRSAATVEVEMTSSSSSVLQGDGAFYNHVISRDSSPSTRVLFYCRSNADGVPFKWETQPGTPKFLPKEEESSVASDRINISPPPALLSLSLPKPSVLITHHAANASSSNAKKLSLFWKFLAGKKRRYRYAHHHPQTQVRRLNNVNNRGMESWENNAGDLEVIPSPGGGNYSSCSSSTLSHYSSNGGDDDDDHSRLSTSNSDSSGGIRSINSSSRSSRNRIPNNDHFHHRGCGGGRPWNFNSFLVCVSGKI